MNLWRRKHRRAAGVATGLEPDFIPLPACLPIKKRLLKKTAILNHI
jgi:hypothetical protein